MTANRDDYERDLRRRQREHLNNIQGVPPWQPCAHDACPECIGTGVRRGGGPCVHYLSCSCPKCAATCFGMDVTR